MTKSMTKTLHPPKEIMQKSIIYSPLSCSKSLFFFISSLDLKGRCFEEYPDPKISFDALVTL